MKKVTLLLVGFFCSLTMFAGEITKEQAMEKARQVSLGEHSFAPIPWDDYRGFPVGVDIRKVVGLNILPISHGGSALKTGGQAGAGAAELPVEVFKKAVVGMVEDVKRREGEAE